MKFCIIILKMFWQRLGWPKSRPAVKKVWAIPTKGDGCLFHSKWHTAWFIQTSWFLIYFIWKNGLQCILSWLWVHYVKLHCLDLNLWSANVKIFCFKILSRWPRQFVWLHCKHSARRGQQCLSNSSASFF